MIPDTAVLDLFPQPAVSTLNMRVVRETYWHLAQQSVSAEEAEAAMDMLLAYMLNTGTTRLAVDLATRNKAHMPARKRTLQQLEEALGYPVEIIEED